MHDVSRFVLGTAGHIDHGKTSLVRVLTGQDLDQLPEEKERGITIALGFTALGLEGDRALAVIDVPGHERLVRTMIAGATGMDGVMLCVSAMDGVMPQTREHLAILGLLGVRCGVIAVTMMDLVDTEMLELAVEDVRECVEGTFLEDAPIVPVSSVTHEGIDVLKAALSSLPEPQRPTQGAFRLPVDRVFVQSGFGTVVTGTTIQGALQDGSPIHLLPTELKARVRGIQSHGESVKRIAAGQRAALNLSGINHEEVERGMIVSDQELPCPSMIDVLYEHLADVGPLDDGAPVRVLCGTTERLGKLHLASHDDVIDEGRTLPAQIRLEKPLPCLPGDRFIIRRTSPLQTLGGGVVVDCWCARMKKRDREAWGSQIQRLHEGDTLAWVERSGDQGLSRADWSMRDREPVGTALGERWYTPTVVEALGQVLLKNLDSYHHEHPLSSGARRGELQRGRLLGVDERTFDALLARHEAEGSLHTDGALTRRTGFQVQLDSEQAGVTERLQRVIRNAKLEGVTTDQLAKDHEGGHLIELLHHLEAGSRVAQVPSVGWVDQDHLNQLKTRLRSWFQDHESLSTAEFKEMSQLTRKTAIPWLEWLDKSRWTRRETNIRRPGSLLED